MPTLLEALTIAAQHHQTGQLEVAEQIYRQILAIDPNHADALHLLGVIASQRGNHQEAEAYIRRAIEINGSEAAFHSNLANALRALRKFDEAILCCRQALDLNPHFAMAHNTLGSVLHEQGRFKDAEACFRRALELKPDLADACSNLGTALQSQGKLDAAVASHRLAVELKPDRAEAYSNLGCALHEQGNVGEAIACHRHALQIKPDDAGTHCNLGLALHAQGKLDEAAASLRYAVALNPKLTQALLNLGNVFLAKGELDEALQCYRRVMELEPNCAEAGSNWVYTFNFCPDRDATSIRQAAISWNQHFAVPLGPSIRAHPNDRDPNRRLRIGYLSPNFCDHVIGRNMIPLLREHDRQQFEIACYSDVRRSDDTTSRFRSYSNMWREIVGLPDETVAQMIRADSIDVLVDLSLHMAKNRLLVFARKPAPMQITFAGYPGTTGLTTIDYRLTDPYLDTPGRYDDLYSEQSIRLPDTFWCYDPQSEEPPVRSLPALESAVITFGCLNNFCKVNAGVLKLWAQVLKAVNRSRIMVLAPFGSHRERTLDMFRQEGIGADRLVFVANCSRHEYLELYNRIDIGLDTVPYNGHTTSLDSLWMGVPVVTLVGQTVVGRAGLSQLSNIGLPELIATTPDQFVTIAVELANDLHRLSNLRQTLRPRMRSSPLMDAHRFARNIEAAYRLIWHRWCVK